jgi:choline dehydrogenase-like flavoprotein
MTPQFGPKMAARSAARAWLPRHSTHDVVVVGSGATGGWAAKELTEAGLDVAVLEAGPGWFEETASRALFRVRRRAGYRVERDARALDRQRTQAKCYAWAGDPHAFVDDVDNPYSTADGKPFAWFRARQLGGRLAVRNHGLYFMRHSDLDFHAASRDGYGDDWPLAYADLVPFYERVERAMGIRGNHDGIAHLPESIYAGPSDSFSPLHLGAKQAIEGRWPERPVIGRRTASPPPALADAFRTGRLTLRANAVASHVVLDKATGKASGVAFVDRRTGRAHEVRGRAVVLCASAIESARILLNSETADGARGLANSSGVLGRYLMDHVYLSGLEGRRAHLPESASDGWSYLYVPQFVNVSPASREPEFLRGYGIQLALSGNAVHAYAFGEMLPRAENRVSLDSDVKDRWGIPAVRIDCAGGGNERKMVEHMVEQTREIMSALGAEIEKPAKLLPPGACIHEVGTARMGRDAKSSVVDSFCRSWDVGNLFIADGASFPSQGVQNPTLTMMALTARCADFIVGALRRAEL